MGIMGYLLVMMQRFVNFLKVVKSNKLKNLYLIPQSDIYTNYENRIVCHPEAIISVLKFIGDDKISSSKINRIVSLSLSKGKQAKLSLLIFKLL